ncbi:MAG: hypothetical protein IJB21_07590 [Bacilli bacterium]|nr:hypothetical protein [Bacilli bacterium]
MQKIKYCPKCQKQYGINQEKCECGYEFVKLESHEDETVQSSNTKVIVDNVPLWIWTFLGFITESVCGWIFYAKFRESYPERSKAARKGAISFYIFLGVVILVTVLYLVLDAKGKIV